MVRPSRRGKFRPLTDEDTTTAVVDGDTVDWDTGGYTSTPSARDQWKQPVRAATTGDITIATALNSGDTLDGVTLATDDRVLVKDQTLEFANGIYIVGTTPARAADFDDPEEVPGAIVYVTEGTVNGGEAFRAENTSPPVMDSDDITFTGFGGGTGGTGPLNNYSATTAPTVNDDSGDGYSVGSVWVDVTADEVYMCVDASSGAAVWNGPFEPDTGGGTGPATISGGTHTTSGGFEYYAFTSSGTLTVSAPGLVEVLVVGGGGGGGGYFSGGGGGGGGVVHIEDYYVDANQAVVIGTGGTPGAAAIGENSSGSFGIPSSFGSLVAAGGGGGGGITGSANQIGISWMRDGASGGGGSGRNTNPAGISIVHGGNAGGTARTGNTGGTGAGGGGGGSSSAGAAAGATNVGGAGGDGETIAAFSAFGASGVFGGGGGGGGVTTGGNGGTGGGGHGGATSANTSLSAGTANTGGGGGGGGNTGTTGAIGAAGGSGVVVVRVPT